MERHISGYVFEIKDDVTKNKILESLQPYLSTLREVSGAKCEVDIDMETRRSKRETMSAADKIIDILEEEIEGDDLNKIQMTVSLTPPKCIENVEVTLKI